MTDLFIGVDMGTSGCKGVLATKTGRVIAEAWSSYNTRRTVDGGVTQDADDWMAAMCRTARELSHRGIGRIAGLCLTAPAHNVVLADNDGRPLGPVLLWSDRRPAAVIDQIYDDVGDLLRPSLVKLGAGWSLSQLAWLRQAGQLESAKVRWVLPGKDYIRFRLTGEAATDPSDAAGTAMYDQMRGGWIDGLAAYLGLAEDVLPPVRRPWDVGGSLRPDWASATGLPAGTPVVVGATDTAAELVSVNGLHAGSGLVKIASTGTVVAVSSGPRHGPGVMTYPHVIPGSWYHVAATNTAAIAYQWLRTEVLAANDGDVTSELDRCERAAASVETGAEGVLFLPFLEGERCPYDDPRLRAGFIGLTARHGRAHLLRAVMEGVAFSLRSCRDALSEYGLTVRAPYLTGGGLRSPLWRQIVVNVLGEAGRFVPSAGPALGAARFAAWAAMGGSTPPRLDGPDGDAVEVAEPEPAVVSAMNVLYQLYREAADVLAPISHGLARLEIARGPVDAD